MTTTANTAEKTEYKAGYKKTELGWIPEGWNIFTLGEISFPPQYGASASSVEYNYNLPRYIRITDIADKGNLVNENKASVPTDDYNSYLLKENDILFARTGATVGKTYIHKSSKLQEKKVIFAGYLIRFVIKSEKALPDYIFQYTKSPKYYNWIKLMYRAGAQPNINSQEYSGMKIPLPLLSEQQKIVKILLSGDKSIEKTENLINTKTKLKKALMAKLLTGKLRFGEFAGEKWKKYKLSDLFERVTRKNTEKNTNVLTISAQQGLISQEEFYKKRIASADTSHYLLLKKGEFAYNKSYSTGYPMGAIKKLDRYESGVVSSLYICFAPKSDDICSSFFAHYFEAGLLNNEIQNIAQEGARNHGLLNIGINEFFNTLLKVPPSIKEQQKIAAVLNACDKEIELLNKQLDKLKDQKKGLMQRLLTAQVRVKVN